MVRIIIAVVVVTSVVAAECVCAMFMIPTAEQVQRHSQQLAEEEAKRKAAESAGAKSVEVSLGKFNVTIHRPELESTMRVSFQLFATVGEKQAPDFANLFKANEHRLRDQIIFEVRNSESADLTDPGLGLIKRRILAKSNELLGQPIVQSVVFSEFSYTQQ